MSYPEHGTDNDRHSYRCFVLARNKFDRMPFRIRDNLVMKATADGWTFLSEDPNIQTNYWVHKINGMDHNNAAACAVQCKVAVPSTG